MKKKLIIIISVIVCLVVLFTPMKRCYNDGGTYEYKSITYSIKKMHSMISAEENGKSVFREGTIVKIIGITVHDDTKEVSYD